MKEESIEDRVSALEKRLTTLEGAALAFNRADIYIVSVICVLGIGAILYMTYM